MAARLGVAQGDPMDGGGAAAIFREAKIVSRGLLMLLELFKAFKAFRSPVTRVTPGF